MSEPQTVGQIITEVTATDGPVLSQPIPEDPAARQEFKDRFNAAAARAYEIADRADAIAQTLAQDPAPEQAPPPPVALDNLAYLVRRRVELTLQIDTFTQARDHIDTAIQEALGNAEGGTIGGKEVVHWPHSRPHRLNQGKLKAEYPEAYRACYETAAPQRRFTIDPVAAMAALRVDQVVR